MDEHLSILMKGFNSRLSPLYGYAFRSQRCIFTHSKRTKNYSVVAAMTDEKLLGCQIFQGSIRGADFAAFVVNLVKRLNLHKDDLDK